MYLMLNPNLDFYSKPQPFLGLNWVYWRELTDCMCLSQDKTSCTLLTPPRSSFVHCTLDFNFLKYTFFFFNNMFEACLSFECFGFLLKPVEILWQNQDNLIFSENLNIASLTQRLNCANDLINKQEHKHTNFVMFKCLIVWLQPGWLCWLFYQTLV